MEALTQLIAAKMGGEKISNEPQAGDCPGSVN
jgi:hypothetical protein